jgi:hypothetical protein
MANIIKLLYGYHQAKSLTPFENARWAMLSKQSVFVARKIKTGLIRGFCNHPKVGKIDHLKFYLHMLLYPQFLTRIYSGERYSSRSLTYAANIRGSEGIIL